MIGGFNKYGEALGNLILSNIPAADVTETNVDFR